VDNGSIQGAQDSSALTPTKLETEVVSPNLGAISSMAPTTTLTPTTVIPPLGGIWDNIEAFINQIGDKDIPTHGSIVAPSVGQLIDRTAVAAMPASLAEQ
jgi:hypothetical protein